MKSTAAFSQLLMLSTSLLCLSSVAAQNPVPSQESKEIEHDARGAVLANTTAQQGGKPERQQGMSSTDKSAQMKKKNCTMGDNPHRFEIKHIEAKGIGYDQGYTSLDAFFTGNICNFIPFIDLRAHVFNNGKWASNVGMGTRYVIDPCQSMVGVNAYYDYRSTKHFHYNQVGAGIEAYYDRFEFLANGYLPVGRKRMRTSHELQSIAFSHFSGNYIVYDTNYKNKYEGAMKGFNAEVGGHIAGDMKNLDLYFGIGPYYYDLKEGKHAWGGKARLKAEVSKYLFLEISDSWDRIFHNRFQGSINLSIPFGVRKCYGKKRMNDNCSNVMDWLATRPVDRQEIIVVDKYKKNQTIDPVAINPTTGQPFFVVFVNNANTDVGVGTYEDPVTCLSHGDAVQTGITPTPPNAQDNSSPTNIIYVFPGDGTNVRMSTGMTLQQGQRMLGSAMAHTVVTTAGVLTIPPQSAATPFITGTTATLPAVMINVNNCEVSGFNIGMQTAFPAGNEALASNGFACIAAANQANVTNVTITNNALVNETYGISLGFLATPAFYIQGDVLVENNVIAMHTASATIGGSGIFVQQAQNANMLIANNDIECNPTIATNVSTGIFVRMSDQVQCSILNNLINSMSNLGIAATWQSSTGVAGPGFTSTCIVQNNTLNNIGSLGFAINSQAPATTPGSIKAIVLDNTVNAQGGSGSQFAVISSGSVPNPGLLVRFNGNTMPAANPVVNFATGTSATATLWVEPLQDNACSFTVGGTAPIIPVVPCQYGGPGCP